MRESTRQKIEAAALSLFARKGLSVTINEIAKTAALSKGLLYSHYPSKEALITELLRQTVVISGTRIKEIVDKDSSAATKIKKISAIMCEMLSKSKIGIDYFMFSIQVSMSGFQIPYTAWYSADTPNPVVSLARIILKWQAEGSTVNGDPVQLVTVYWAAIQRLCCYVITGILFSPIPETLSRIILKK